MKAEFQYADALMAELATSPSRGDASISLNQVAMMSAEVAGMAEARGDLDRALSHYEESLALHLRWMVVLVTSDRPGPIKDVVTIAIFGARIEISPSRAEAARARLESVFEQVCPRESDSDPYTLDTAAAYWECCTEALEMLCCFSEAATGRLTFARVHRGAACYGRLGDGVVMYLCCPRTRTVRTRQHA